MQASVTLGQIEDNSVHNKSPAATNPYKVTTATGKNLNNYQDTAASVTKSIDTIASQQLPSVKELPFVSIQSRMYPNYILTSYLNFDNNCKLCHEPLELGYSTKKLLNRVTGYTNWCCLDCKNKHIPIEEKHTCSHRDKGIIVSIHRDQRMLL